MTSLMGKSVLVNDFGSVAIDSVIDVSVCKGGCPTGPPVTQTLFLVCNFSRFVITILKILEKLLNNSVEIFLFIFVRDCSLFLQFCTPYFLPRQHIS